MSSRPLRVLTVAALAIAVCACAPRGHTQSLPDQSVQSAAFLKKNGAAEGVKTLPDGLQIKVVKSGPAGGASVKAGDEVKVMYEGALIDGTVFDSSYQRGEPDVFTVGEVVPAWNEALEMMHPGDVWYLYVPPTLGYGDHGAGPIPPNAVMVFKIELLGVLPHGGAGGAQG
ncbi:MAG TPA: FKBP-type peptidyl-prolyl cis-trans isomerase [Caulobacteraceae bacterium]|jgi:peptidylprolyl isomerase/FKBP-type peptidyl-prolyl cis-trans isomerase FklB|nr:FKBP-type peptidyl-prolyl cis-trans isomerase [Caulobacteraceae bacterium]